jgi:hypothetical protein
MLQVHDLVFLQEWLFLIKQNNDQDPHGIK